MSTLKESLKKIKPLLIVYRKLREIFSTKNENYRETYKDIRYRLEEEDQKSVSKDKTLKALHEKLQELKLDQEKNWDSMVYCAGYYYQGYQRIGIHGIKPTEPRMKNYELETYLSKDKTVLDIGSNSGWVACYLSDFTKNVDGIELNPYLVKMGEATIDFLNIQNVNFIVDDFIKYNFSKKYDLIFSLSNHFTIDGNLNIGFESYIRKIFNTLNVGGVLFFESHNINGDDKDMDLKFEIASKYFTLEKYKMVKAFFPQDIDKLFAVFKKRDVSGSPIKTNFILENAKKNYNY
jgi:protein-L-isoaspartate O-methyltransferase